MGRRKDRDDIEEELVDTREGRESREENAERGWVDDVGEG
jgi:hypothetical protein